MLRSTHGNDVSRLGWKLARGLWEDRGDKLLRVGFFDPCPLGRLVFGKSKRLNLKTKVVAGRKHSSNR